MHGQLIRFVHAILSAAQSQRLTELHLKTKVWKTRGIRLIGKRSKLIYKVTKHRQGKWYTNVSTATHKQV